MLEGKYEKLEFQDMLSSPHWRIKKWARTNKKCWKKKQKKNRESKKNDEKRKMNEKTMKNDLSWNDPWSDHPETQFGPTYPFFRKPEPWPTLHT